MTTLKDCELQIVTGNGEKAKSEPLGYLQYIHQKRRDRIASNRFTLPYFPSTSR
jgi:hypothetical protein